MRMPEQIRLHKHKTNQASDHVEPIGQTPSEPRLAPLSCDQEASLKSGNGQTSTLVRFNNLMSSQAEVYWINYNGKEIFWFELPSNASVDEQTFAGHPWVVKDVAGKCLALFLAASTPSIAEVQIGMYRVFSDLRDKTSLMALHRDVRQASSG